MHHRRTVGHNVQPTHANALRLRLNPQFVLAQMQTVPRREQGQGGHADVVVPQQKGNAAKVTIFVQGDRKMTNACRHRTDPSDRVLRRCGGDRKARRVRQNAAVRIGGQRRAGTARQGVARSQEYVAGPLDAGGQARVRIQSLLRLVYGAAQLRRQRGCVPRPRHRVPHFAKVGKATVGLGFGKRRGQDNGLGASRRKLVDQLGVDIP